MPVARQMYVTVERGMLTHPLIRGRTGIGMQQVFWFRDFLNN